MRTQRERERECVCASGWRLRRVEWGKREEIIWSGESEREAGSKR